MTKKKKFRPTKVGNRGYTPGKRQRMFSYPPRPTVRKEQAPTSAPARTSREVE